MKKLFSIFLTLLVITFCIAESAFADEFSVRNGIQFGMSIEQVKQIEKNNGITNYDHESDSMLRFYTSLAGIEKSHVEYCFDDETNKLYEILYYFNDRQSESTFKSMSQSLIDKYGQPLHSSFSDKIVFPIRTYMLNVHGISYTNKILGDYYEWLIDYGEYYALIDIVLYPDSQTFYPYHCGIGYKYVTNEDIQSKLEQLNESEKKLITEKNRDL